MEHTLAQGLIINPSGSKPITVTGPLTDISTLGDLINKLMAFILPLSGIILFFVIVWGGYDILLSQGDPEKLQSGKNKITAGIIGMVLLVLSFLITRIIGFIFGVGDGVI